MNKELDIAALESLSVADNYNKLVTKLLINNLNIKDHIVDFGAGYGQFTERIKNQNYKISAIEINNTAIKKLLEKNITTFKSFEEIADPIGCIISLNVLEHIEDDDSYVKKFHKNLSTNGKLILYLPASKMVWTELDDVVNHKRRYSKKELEDLLILNNFMIEKIYYVDFIGWLVLLLSKFFRIKLDFVPKKIKFYDKFIFRIFKYLDIFTKKIIGKNLFIVASKKEVAIIE
tara:strand:+ start:252 stop:947 length:696 start_codon:yes stop_codon:yes gene_type:complete